MNAHKSPRYLLIGLFVAFVLMLSACQPAALAATSQPTQGADTPADAATQSASNTPAGIMLDYSGVAQNMTVETMTAVPATADRPYWEVGPQYQLMTLQGYPIVSHLFKAQIYFYLVSDLAPANETMGKIAANLQTLLQNQNIGSSMPLLPLFNAGQMMHPQIQFLDFKSGKGVRFLTQIAQGLVPVNNNDMIYTFQGLTNDAKYYISAILPVTNPELPVDATISGQLSDEMRDYTGYLRGVVNSLAQQPAATFTPDLTKLDALVRSIEVK